jgi:Protein of unknown function (DUF1465)
LRINPFLRIDLRDTGFRIIIQAQESAETMVFLKDYRNPYRVEQDPIMSERGLNTISFAGRVASSAQFKTIYSEGMTLVEETASYLDGPGRSAAKGLPRMASVLYAAESMRLTTRLMQMASWCSVPSTMAK